jgi:hypothetical protein
VKTGISSDPRSVKAATNDVSLVGAALASLDRLLSEAKGFLDGILSNSPAGALPAGALPTGAGSASGGSGASGGSTGFVLLGALAFLSTLLLSGKHLWAAREFLKPSSALLPIIERPG